MSAYLFEIELPPITDEITAMIPEHREHVANLFSQGRLFSYSVSHNRKMVWCVVNAEDEQLHTLLTGDCPSEYPRAKEKRIARTQEPAEPVRAGSQHPKAAPEDLGGSTGA